MKILAWFIFVLVCFIPATIGFLSFVIFHPLKVGFDGGERLLDKFYIWNSTP